MWCFLHSPDYPHVLFRISAVKQFSRHCYHAIPVSLCQLLFIPTLRSPALFYKFVNMSTTPPKYEGFKYENSSVAYSGLDHIRNPRLNKGSAFTIEERQQLRIHGLFGRKVRTMDEQVECCKLILARYGNELDKYMYLATLQTTNERLFYKLMMGNVAEFMPIVYTPIVGEACQKFSLLYDRPRGLYVTIHDKGHIYDLLSNWPEKDIKAVVVTDGERILGLGDLGANGMGIPVGKLSLYTALAGIQPHQCLPVTLDVGTNTQSLLDDPIYFGIKKKRIGGQEYDDFLDEFMRAIVKKYGRYTLIQFEDFANANAFRLLEKYRSDYCTFNDDIQGTAAVGVAGLLASLRITKTKLSDHVMVFVGAGEASLGIASLCVMAMREEGISESQARSKIWLIDSQGLVVSDRQGSAISEHKRPYAHSHKPIKCLEDVVKELKPTILIGASAQSGIFTESVLKEMAKNAKNPVIFALSNPTDRAECTAEQAYTATKGAAIFASGSPFPTFTYGGKVYEPGQGNNAYIFPGIALAAICAGFKTIGEDLFLASAKVLANMVSEEDLKKGSLYPPLAVIQKCSINIAECLMTMAYKNGNATVLPEPENKKAVIEAYFYKPEYQPSVSNTYNVPN